MNNQISKHKRLGLRAACFLTTLAPSFALAQAIVRFDPQASINIPVLKLEEGYVDAHGVLIYYKSIGNGPPLLIVHGGPGASHDYFLPHLLPLARQNRLVFIDERGSGRSGKLENPAEYTV